MSKKVQKTKDKTIDSIDNPIESLLPLFYDADSSKLTFVGALAIIGLGIGLVPLAISVVRRLYF